MRIAAYLAGAALLAGTLGMSAKSAKRGVSENQFQFKAQMEALAPGVSWYYNWGNTAGRYLAAETYMEFVPMCWNGSYNAENIRTFVKDHPEVKYLLGFNEPNFTNQANMTPAAAAQQWPAVQALAAELGLELVAPALNYSPNPPYQSPTQWMDEFVALVGKDAFDYVAVHSYGGFGVMKDLATTFHERYGKPVWVTEFCYWPEEGNPNSTVAPEAQIASMIQSVEWLEKTEWIYRYAWFKAVGNSSAATGPNYGLLIAGKAEDPRELSEQGKVFVYMSDFDESVYHPINTPVAASEFIAQNGVLLGSNTDEAVDYPIEITRFSAGATADYQFDVPEAGDYKLTVRVGGQGEPARFDPSIGVYAVADGEETGELAAARKFTLPGTDNAYKTEEFAVKLQAGKQTIRLRDTAPSQPSGIRISAVSLETPDHSGIEDVAADAESGPVDVYNLQGMRLRRGVEAHEALKGLPAGMYVVGSKKVLVRD
ncbi:MAG: hypothetical protein K2L76_07385 [Muribaculaceae bacterium]|nr:hypothetical protein [Muribaculaceae bacterium]